MMRKLFLIWIVVVFGMATVYSQPSNILVSGFVWSSADTPISEATVQLRNICTGEILASSITDETGFFQMSITTPANVVVEYVRDKAVIGVGFPMYVSYGETAVTFVKVPVGVAIIPSLSPVVSSVMLAAAQVGIKAIEYVGTPASPIR